jgi:hypothetical protein
MSVRTPSFRDDCEEVAKYFLSVSTFAGGIIWTILLNPNNSKDLQGARYLAFAGVFFIIGIELCALILISARAGSRYLILDFEVAITAAALFIAFFFLFYSENFSVPFYTQYMTFVILFAIVAFFISLRFFCSVCKHSNRPKTRESGTERPTIG